MRFHVITLFPGLIEECVNTSIIGRARSKGLIDIYTTCLKDFSTNSYGSVDDYTYGGGAGMLIGCEPVYRAFEAASSNVPEGGEYKFIYTSPQGKTFDQRAAEALSGYEDLIFLCGHYEGVDERVLEELEAESYSIGDYVLTGGELPAAVMIDAIARLVPGVLHNGDSAEDESFNGGLLEYPQYTRPAVWKDREVPEVLLSGDHKKVEQYRHLKAVERTRERRPDMYEEYLRARGIW
ncbi:MAG: tRNA (guanosine(37)-N1)-methyltransferase TrmD [Lachnospiraceae bacterium]|nr:tRNA (guanosine(37)-N1)-methyltransferase TrmD [Lachnospiraceae bacterium]